MVVAQFFEFSGEPLPKGSVIATIWHSNARPMDGETLSEVLKIFPSYRSLQQGRSSAKDQFEARYGFDKDKAIGGCAFNFHKSFTGVGFVFPTLEECPEQDEHQLFHITLKGIEPLVGKFPESLRLPE